MRTTEHAVLFDLDETLIDRRKGLLDYADYMLSAHTVEAPSAAAFHTSFLALDNNGRTPRKAFFEQLCAQHLPGTDPAQVLAHFIAHAWIHPPVFSDTEAVLTALRERGYRIGIVSNGQSATQRAKIAHSCLQRLADCVVISEEFGCKKPDPRIFAQALQTLSATAEATWFVGDCPVADMQGAHAAGLRPLWLERHTPWPEAQPRVYAARVTTLTEALHVLP